MAIINIIKNFWTASIQRQLMAGIILVHAVLMSIFVYDLVDRQRIFLHTQSISHAQSLAQTLAANSVSWILSNDVIGLEEILESQTHYPDLLYAMVLSPDNRVLAHTDIINTGLYVTDEISQSILHTKIKQRTLIDSSNLIDVVTSIFSNEQLIGWARVGLGQEKIASSLSIITRDGILYTVLAILLGSLFAFFMAKYITSGLKHIVEVADSIKQGNVTVRSNLTRQDELGQLSNDFNRMLDTINRNKRDQQAILDHSPAIIYAKDIDGRYIFVNKKWLDLHEQTNNNVIGKTDSDIFSDDFSTTLSPNEKAVLSTGKAIESEEITPYKHGVYTYFTVKFPLFDKNNIVYSVCGISSNISERKTMEEELRASTQHLTLYREQSPLAAIEWDTNFEIVFWNKAAEKTFGWTFDEVIGRNPLDFLIPKNVTLNVEQVWTELLAQTGGENETNENITKDGRTILCEWHNTAIKDTSGKVIGVASIAINITEKKLQEDQLRRSQKMDALGKLTGGIAHDFNNMLGVIIGYSDLLKTSLAEQSHLVKYVDEINRAGERGAKLTSKLLAFSRQKEGEKAEVNINTLLHERQHMLEKTLTARIKIELNLAENLWPIWIDSDELEDAILNMCINSMHAMESTGQLCIQTLNTKIDTEHSNILNIKPGDYVQLNIIDNGSGIDESTKEKIFDPFFSTKGELGTGLGLSQVYGFIEGNSGKIIVHSEPGKGTTMMLYFPRYFANKSNGKQIPDNADISLSGTESILIVDDEPALLNLLTEILSQQGYHVFTAVNAKQALQTLDSQSIHLMFSDVIMPDMDGYKLATIVQERFPAVKILLASGFTDNRKTKVNNNKLIHKPYNTHKLLQRLRQSLDE
jgi:PAS domain S-box-containing protein